MLDFLKLQGMKAVNPSCLVLKGADVLQVLYDVFVLLQVAVHHGGGGSKAQPVGLKVNLRPLVYCALGKEAAYLYLTVWRGFRNHPLGCSPGPLP